jgi:arylsulfatase A-like enzyme/predicted Zn-dependent protease
MHNSNRLLMLLVGLLLTGLAVAACQGPGAEIQSHPGANVLLVSIDTLRADRLGAYGYGPADTPRLDALAAEGIRFEQVVSPVPLTLPSHTSILTSMQPPAHGVRDNGAFALSDKAVLLAEVFQEAGYDTGAFVGAFVLHSRWGLSPGFSEYDDRFEYGKAETTPGQVERRGDAVVEVTLDWLGQPREEQTPFFAWTHLYDPHAPYAAPEPYGSRFPDQPYDAEVAYTDSLIGQLLDGLDELGVLEDTIVLVVADHGEGLNDHDEPGHGLFLYDPTVLVPMILRLPGLEHAGLEVAQQVRLIDIAPTLLELTALPVPAAFDGASMTPLLSGEGASRPGYSETFFPRLHFGWQEIYALRSDNYKYILAPRPELYLVDADPGETTNLIDAQPARAAAMRAELEEMRGVATDVHAGEMSTEALQRLRSLGYIGAAPADVDATNEELPDPKDKLDLFRRLTQGQSLVQSGEMELAAEVLEDLVAEDPRIVDGHFTLGNARFALGDYEGAAAAFRTTIELLPEYDLALSNLGMCQRRLGNINAARDTFDALLLMSPTSLSAHFNLGEMDLDDNNPTSARQHFEAGLANNDAMPSMHFGLGVAAFQLGDMRQAAQSLEVTAEMASGYPQVHYYLAQLAEARGDRREAEAEYRAEVANNPQSHRAWFNLSVLLSDAGDHEGAVEALRQAVAAEPDLAVAHVYLGRSLLLLEDPALYQEALQAAQRGLELGPPLEVVPTAHFVLADLYNRLGQPDSAQREVALGRAAQQRLRQR